MNVAPAIAVFTLVLVGASDPALVSAQKRLDTARDNLAKAISRIEKDPPATPDLDAAHTAVGALKDAIDAGADFEAKDLEYAKSALAARKEWRTQKEYVDKRRANVHIHNHRRSLDAALTTLTEKAKRTESKDASAKDFDDARAAANAVEKGLKDAQPFAKDDDKFAAYLKELDATVDRTRKSLDDRWTLRAVDKHRGVLEEARQGLTQALGALSKGGSDAQFEAADKAAATLSQKLEEGTVFEPRDKAYKADADKARAELSQSKKRMEELLTATALERLKAEIEPAHKDLTAALKNLKARKPTEEQLAEARTASIVVRKLVEKFQPQAARSQAFGQYVAEVKKTLVETEVVLQRRALDAARADVTQAVRNIQRSNPSDEQFAELATALTVLEKTLESVHQKDPALVAHVGDAKKQLREAKETSEKRRGEVDLQRQRAKVRETRSQTEATVRAIQPANIGDEHLTEAEKAVDILKRVLDEGKAFVKKDRDYALYDKEVRERINELTGRIAARRITLAASRARAQLTSLIADGKAKLEAARRPEGTDADVEATGKAVEALTQALDANAELEKKDAGYASSAERGREQLVRQMEGLELAKQERELRRQTGEAYAAGMAASAAANETQDLRKQKELADRAVASFRSCEKEGNTLVRYNPSLARVAVKVDEGTRTPKEVVALCAEQAAAAETRLRGVTAILAFEDGPKRSFEAGHALLGKGRKSEALPQFDSCISSGKFAEYKYPELKERKFQVAGASMTMAEVISQCVNQRKLLVAK